MLPTHDALLASLEVLLPVAEELGLGFTIQELRAYETRLKLERGMARDGEYDRSEHSYWLLERGWEEPRPEEKANKR